MYTHLILNYFQLCCYDCFCLVVSPLEYVNKLVMVQGHTEIPRGECHRHGKGFGKERTRFRLSMIFRIFGVDASRCADEILHFFCACAVVFPLKY